MISLTVIPQILATVPHRLPTGIVVTLSMLQSGIFVALAVWAGVAMSPSLGLGAPVFEAALSGTGTWAALKTQLKPAVIAGLLAGFMLVYLQQIAPAELLGLAKTYDISLAAKLLYGGITEEVLMRWGLMTLLIWLPWQLIQKRAGPPRPPIVISAIALAALLFGVGHLPAVAAMGASLSPKVITYIIVGNTLPALLFGYLYWRRGLEAAIFAHALGHVIGVLAGAI